MHTPHASALHKAAKYRSCCQAETEFQDVPCTENARCTQSWAFKFVLSRQSTFLSLLAAMIALETQTLISAGVGNSDSCMNSHYPLISRHKYLCSNNCALMSWQKREKTVSRIWEWLSGNKDKDDAWRTARTRNGQEKRSHKLWSTALQAKWEFSYYLFPKATFSHSSPCNIPQNNGRSVAD